MHVTKGEAETFPVILQKLSSFPAYAPYFPLPQPSILQNKRYVNEKKVTDHYAIIPTEQVVAPEKLSDDERKVYDLVVRRLIAAHHQAAVIDYTTVTTLVDGRARFVSKGRQVVEEGWRAVIRPHEEEKDAALPPR